MKSLNRVCCVDTANHNLLRLEPSAAAQRPAQEEVLQDQAHVTASLLFSQPEVKLNQKHPPTALPAAE